eukprot:2349066-Pyramimonas_sp.AAC.1
METLLSALQTGRLLSARAAREVPKVPPTSASCTAGGAAGAARKGARILPEVAPTSATRTQLSAASKDAR